MSDEYKPISCDLHSQYELWIIRGQDIKLAWHDDNDITHIEQVTPLDVRAETGVEYLFFQDKLMLQHRIRLDRIFRASDVDSR